MTGRRIRDEFLSEVFAHSSGPGGQNVNKRETKVQLSYRFGDDPALSDAEKERIRAKAKPSELVGTDTLRIEVSDTRSREQNRAIAKIRLEERFESLLHVQKKRRPRSKTLPAHIKHARRQTEDKRRRTKQHRRKPGLSD